MIQSALEGTGRRMRWRTSLLFGSGALAVWSVSRMSTDTGRRVARSAGAALGRVPGVTPLAIRLRLAELERRLDATIAFLRDAEPQLAEIERRDREFERRIARLEITEDDREAHVQNAAALAWDREAVIRRLAALEDALADRN